MAGDQLNRERRALLGAALGLPLVRHSGLDPGPQATAGQSTFLAAGDEGRWTPDQACPEQGRRVQGDAEGTRAAWDAALTAFRAAADAVAGEERARAGASFEEAEAGQERYDRLCGAMEEALLDLLGCPAPDVAALAVKLQLADAHEVWTMNGGEGVPAALAAEALRLGSEQAKRPAG